MLLPPSRVNAASHYEAAPSSPEAEPTWHFIRLPKLISHEPIAFLHHRLMTEVRICLPIGRGGGSARLCLPDKEKEEAGRGEAAMVPPLLVCSLR